ncbi:hypothetical protein E2C01_086286 [Portunus trituberculatus]|uniref:Uncharacterized protein n=1 Tax=Portunus trituberculatus TaxID=210409 RepID=A0A5B7J511_PORTR|nr:hypothetical protein [Portunus trituberculatus]
MRCTRRLAPGQGLRYACVYSFIPCLHRLHRCS